MLEERPYKSTVVVDGSSNVDPTPLRGIISIFSACTLCGEYITGLWYRLVDWASTKALRRANKARGCRSEDGQQVVQYEVVLRHHLQIPGGSRRVVAVVLCGGEKYFGDLFWRSLGEHSMADLGKK